MRHQIGAVPPRPLNHPRTVGAHRDQLRGRLVDGRASDSAGESEVPGDAARARPLIDALADEPYNEPRAYAKIVELNPLLHYLDIVRAPLLGADQELRHWVVVLSLTVIGWILAALAMRQYRARVPYWV